jgi:hypothetical protein
VLAGAETKTVVEGEQEDDGAEEGREEGEESSRPTSCAGVASQHDPTVGVCEVCDGPDEKEGSDDSGEDVEDTSTVVLLHVEAVGDDEEVEADREPDEGRENTDHDA